MQKVESLPRLKRVKTEWAAFGHFTGGGNELKQRSLSACIALAARPCILDSSQLLKQHKLHVSDIYFDAHSFILAYPSPTSLQFLPMGSLAMIYDPLLHPSTHTPPPTSGPCISQCQLISCRRCSSIMMHKRSLNVVNCKTRWTAVWM